MDNENKTFRAVYDDGEIRFTEPAHIEGEWRVTITFIERIDDTSVPTEADPHRHKHGSWTERLEEAHRNIDSERRTNPY